MVKTTEDDEDEQPRYVLQTTTARALNAEPWLQKNAICHHRNTLKTLAAALQHVRPRKPRNILDFAEQEIRYPTGRHKGKLFRRELQPATSLLLQQLENPHWRQTFVIGPHQAGKTLSITIFLMWVLFEKQEDLIFGMPDVTMRAVKWRKDIRPMILASKYRRYLPTRGAGSRGGVPEIVLFLNQVSMQFMGAGGGDAQRSGATSRFLIITECEKFGVRAAASNESNKFEQICGRVQHFAGSEKIVAESTITNEDGLMWTNYTAGSRSQVHCQCHSCDEYVAPEREHLVGWQDAKTEHDARIGARFSCPSCGIFWTEDQRKTNLLSSVLVHFGQTVNAQGVIAGPPPPTAKLGFRFSAATNAFADAGSIGVEEHTLARAATNQRRLDLETALKQFRFATPTTAEISVIDPLDVRRLMTRVESRGRGIVPADCIRIATGTDIRKTQMHWFCIAECHAGLRVIDWGVERLLTENALFEDQLLEVGGRLIDRFADGWHQEDTDEMVPSDLNMFDGGWQTWHVQQLADTCDYSMPCMGFGAGILSGKKYRSPTAQTAASRIIGESFHVARVRDRLLCQLDSGSWKSALHSRLRLSVTDQGALIFPDAAETDLRELMQHLTSESEIEEYIGGQLTSKFSDPVGENHWFDAAYYAFAGLTVEAEIMKLIDAQNAEPESIEWSPEITGPTGF